MDDPQTFLIKIGLAVRLGVTDWFWFRGSFSAFLNLSLFLFVAISYVARNLEECDRYANWVRGTYLGAEATFAGPLLSLI